MYYRIPAENTGQLRARALEVFQDVVHETGVAGRLMRRRDDPGTWMEVYEGVADVATFEAALAASVLRRDFTHLLAPGEMRKNEIFQPG
ncbi:MAG: DUF4936 family protein [Betaproteobacteria bacterium]|nr:DUF4936 family protein [Betaproteobacteria bacterium]